MLQHADIWRAIDRLAAECGMSPSGLAKRAGLDPTTFNKSKRVTGEGKQRWPSTESIAKILEATDTSFAHFVALTGLSGARRSGRRIPVIGLAQAGGPGPFEGDRPSGRGWDEVVFPDLDDPHAFALEISGDSMAPVYRDGDLVVVSPAASVRRGDRVVVRTRTGEMLAKCLARTSANRVELASFASGEPDCQLGTDDIDWMARIVWASQ